jgi:hypothetical protein
MQGDATAKKPSQTRLLATKRTEEYTMETPLYRPRAAGKGTTITTSPVMRSRTYTDTLVPRGDHVHVTQQTRLQ